MNSAHGIAVKFTPGQRRQLQQLLDAGALDRDSAKGPSAEGMRGCSPMVIGKLRDLGLADSRTVRAGAYGPHGQYTAYWLTASGLDAARALEVVSC